MHARRDAERVRGKHVRTYVHARVYQPGSGEFRSRTISTKICTIRVCDACFFEKHRNKPFNRKRGASRDLPGGGGGGYLLARVSTGSWRARDGGICNASFVRGLPQYPESHVNLESAVQPPPPPPPPPNVSASPFTGGCRQFVTSDRSARSETSVVRPSNRRLSALLCLFNFNTP